jgi:hypothetical protein
MAAVVVSHGARGALLIINTSKGSIPVPLSSYSFSGYKTLSRDKVEYL